LGELVCLLADGWPASGSGNERFGDDDEEDDIPASVAVDGLLELEPEALYCCWLTVGTDSVTTGWMEGLVDGGCDGGV